MILLDEPLSNLDAKLRDEARAWLKTLIRDLGLAALCVTHDQLEAMALAERIVLLNGGFVEQAGTPTELYAQPRSLFAAEFMGMNNRVEGVLDSVANGHARLQVEGVVLEGEARSDALTPGGSGVGVIRLERVRLADAPGPNRVPMQLQTAMYLGERFELLLRRGKWTVRAFADCAPNAQEHLVELPADALWIY